MKLGFVPDRWRVHLLTNEADRAMRSVNSELRVFSSRSTSPSDPHRQQNSLSLSLYIYIFGWLLGALFVTMAYGLRMGGRLGASVECYIAHNVHVCSNLAKKAQCAYLQGDTHVTELASPPTYSTFRPCLDTLSLPSSSYLGILTTEGEPLSRSPPARVQLNKNRPITAW